MMTSLQNRFLLVTWGILFGTAIVQTQLCPTGVSNGMVTKSCPRQPGDTCTFTCNPGFKNALGVSSVTCGSNGNWTFTSAVCVETKAICPQNFTGGNWVNCHYGENETCLYSCFSSFRRNTRILNATCGSDGAWNQNTQKLCTRNCVMGIRNGNLNSSCTFTNGEVCSFTCNLGFKAIFGVRTVTCQESGEWVPAEPCKEVLCPTTIKNGTVDEIVCNRRVYSECPFKCDQGFDPNPKSGKLFCGIYGNWIEAVSPSCLERQGLCINVFERGRWANGCQFRAMETCAFECNRGFQKNPNITGNITCTLSAEWNMDLKLLCISYDRGLIVTLTSGDTADSNYIETVPTTTEGAPTLNSVRTFSFGANLWLLSVDGDYALRQAYAYEYYSSTIYMYSNFSFDSSGANRWTPVHRGVSRDYLKLAVDWINHNIYWTDPQYKWIVVQSLVGNDTSKYRVLIDDNLEEPRALALDPMEALLFWSDIGSFTKIEVSSLSGRNRKSLISSNLITPYSLAADYRARRIYWSDSNRYTLESINYEGKERKILLRNSDKTFFDLVIYKDYLYATDYMEVHFLNKTNGKKLKNSFSREGETYYGVTVFHPEAQPTSVAAYCVNYGCDHICVTEKDGASCVCRDGYILNQDMKTCSENNKYFHRGLMFSNDSSICIVDIRVLTHFSYFPKCVLNIKCTRYMVLDTDQRQMIIANDTSIYWTMVDKLELHVLTKQSGIISGLAWDGYDRNLYWSENDTGSIWRLSRESGNAIVFLSGLINPRDIVILPHERLLYWISDRNGSTIEYCSLDGSNHQVLLDNKILIKPKSLSYDMYAKRIYFLDIAPNGFSYLYSCKLDGSDLANFLSTLLILEKLAFYKGHLLMTSNNANGTLIMSYSINHAENTTSGVFPGAGNISSIKIFDENFRQNETGPCYNLNGGCQQICLSNGKSRICECTFGFKLAPNGKNCLTNPIKDNFMLIGDSTHEGIYQISLTDQTIQGINAKVMDFAGGVTYSPVHDLVIWGTEQSEISIIHLNGSGQHIFSISDSKNVYPNRVAVDFSTGNIYYTAVSYLEFVDKYNGHMGVIMPNGKHKVILTRLSYPHGLVLYPSKGLLFYTDTGSETYIGQSNMDGTQASVLLDVSNDRFPSELTIDYKNDYLYWLDNMDSSICYCKLDGTNYQTLVKYPQANLNGLALFQDYLYIAAEEYLNMRKVKISNPKETTEFAAYGELGIISSITIYSSTVQSKNAFCLADNGGCSTFCFPTPRGGLCSCEDGVHLKDGSDKVCSNIPQCPVMQGTIIVSADCQRLNGSKCNFTCTQGYNARQDVKNVICNGVTYTPADSCEEIKCPGSVANGKWVNCDFAAGKTCEYTCDYGYTTNNANAEVECQPDGNWKSVYVDNLCKPITCPKEFSQGIISRTCEIKVGQSCDYDCTEHGYKKNENISQIKCTESGTWERDTGIICHPSPASFLERKSEVSQAAIGSGVGIGVTIVIVIIVVTVFFILRRRRRNSASALKRMQVEVMNATFGFEPDNMQVSYENGSVHIIDVKKTEEPQNLTPHSINTGRDASKIYDESMTIPRPRTNKNPHTSKF